ncbi:hypothetical protein LG301_15365 [Vreelandella venusta]|uniref:hypothetical protein n=1 Tax=Vreelandella venusta TaxID=44935 RepID=UPI00384ADE32
MKAFNIAAAIALALFSSVALAERGSGEANKIAYPDSSLQQQVSDAEHFTPDELQTRNP